MPRARPKARCWRWIDRGPCLPTGHTGGREGVRTFKAAVVSDKNELRPGGRHGRPWAGKLGPAGLKHKAPGHSLARGLCADADLSSRADASKANQEHAPSLPPSGEPASQHPPALPCPALPVTEHAPRSPQSAGRLHLCEPRSARHAMTSGSAGTWTFLCCHKFWRSPLCGSGALGLRFAAVPSGRRFAPPSAP